MRPWYYILRLYSRGALSPFFLSHSYAVSIDGTPFGRLAYRGECRPSTTFADAAVNADLLIHEATFEDGMEEEANLKRHCTVGEALMIGRRMRARAVALTHFSQRYRLSIRSRVLKRFLEQPVTPWRLPWYNVSMTPPTHVLFAFDFMKLTPDTMAVASALTPALRLLYPSDDEESEHINSKDEPPRVSLASAILSVPASLPKRTYFDTVTSKSRSKLDGAFAFMTHYCIQRQYMK